LNKKNKSQLFFKKLFFKQHLPAKKSSDKKSYSYIIDNADDAVESSEQSDFKSINKDEEKEETVLLIKKLISRANLLIWSADTGTSSHMSD